VDPKAGLDDVEKKKFLTLPGLELRPLPHSARSQSLYRLRYPRSNKGLSSHNNNIIIYFSPRSRSSRRWEDNINEVFTESCRPNLADSVMGSREDYYEISGFIKGQRISYGGEQLSVSEVLRSRQ
jgi:hypothetical protein